MAGDFLKIELNGLDDFIDGLKKAEKNVMDEIEKEMKDYSLLVETGSRALAHRFEGTLEQSISAAPVRRVGNVVIGSVGSNLVYAWIRHEAPYRPGTHDLYDNGAYFPKYYLNGRGRRTHRKASWRGELPGRKYLERAVVVTEDDFENGMADALLRGLRGLI